MMTPDYVADCVANYFSGSEDAVIEMALSILNRRHDKSANGAAFDCPDSVANFLRLQFAGIQREHEEFGVMFLDAQNRLISFERMFRGTLTQTSVYPREVVKAAIKCSAASAVVCHNHPSGLCEPSRADEHLTGTLKECLKMVDVKLLDHFVLGGNSWVSFAQRGLI